MNIFLHRSLLHTFCSKASRPYRPVLMSIIHFTYISDLKRQTANRKRCVNHPIVKRSPRQSPRERYHCSTTVWKQKWRKRRGSCRFLFVCFFPPSSKYFCTSWRLSIGNFQQSALPFFKKTVRRTVTRVRSLYVGLKPKRALGFKCDLKKCDSALMDCSAGACRKKGMIFGEPSQRPCTSRTVDSSVSDTSTVSSTSEDTF